jgi:hypothetical protein
MARRVHNVTWPEGRAPDVPYLGAGATDWGAAPGTYPVPSGRGRWRLTLHRRAFAPNLTYDALGVTEIMGARSRQLTQEWNKGATLTFSLDGASAAASLITELQHDVIAWRWDDRTGYDQPLFRGVVCQSQDTLSEQADTVTFTCHDYLAMLERRLLPTQVVYTQWDQDALAADLVARAKAVTTSGGQSLNPGAYLPAMVVKVDPAGNARQSSSGIKRDRTYEASQKVDEALANLAVCEQGFDYDIVPGGHRYSGGVGGDDILRLFYPYQGVLRPDVVLEYGSSVSSLSRSVNSGDYANYWRVVGATADGATAPMYAERWNTDANNVAAVPLGLWQSGDNASDVSVQATLNDKAGADLALSGVLVPSYSLDLRPGWYAYGNPFMGDVVRLRVRAGRLAVDTDVRVLGIAYDILDDADEDVSLTVGRPDVQFTDLFTRTMRDVDALSRR